MLALLWAVFLYANLSAYIEHPRLTILLFVLTQTEFIIFLLIRSTPVAISKNWNDYLIAIAGTFVVLLFQPVTYSMVYGDFFIYTAVIFEIIAYLSLNTSTGIAPANRGVKTRGLYKFVRHPIYASYILLYVGYVINNSSLFNWVILCLAFVLQVFRLQREERVLLADPVYKEYAAKVKWKLIPGLF